LTEPHAAGGAVRLFLLRLLGPIERFMAQWISVSTKPSAFVRERIHLGDTTNFLRAVGFCFSAISAAFLAEVAVLHLVGIGGLTELYYWLVILLTSIPFVLISFVLIRLVQPLPLRDVVHLSLHPIGAGVFAGAAFALIVAAGVTLLIAIGHIDEIRYDFSQYGAEEQMVAVYKQTLHECLKHQSLPYTVLAAGLGDAYQGLKSPVDNISGFVRR
jgi:hypothetical protein